MNRALRRHDVRLLAVATVASLGLMVGLAHSGLEGDRMGEATAMCLAVAASTAIAVASAPRVGRLVARPPRAASWAHPREPAITACARIVELEVTPRSSRSSGGDQAAMSRLRHRPTSI